MDRLRAGGYVHKRPGNSLPHRSSFSRDCGNKVGFRESFAVRQDNFTVDSDFDKDSTLLIASFVPF